jgi:gas vesicle protein
MEFAQKFREAVDSFTAETKTNVTELRYNVENTVKNAISEGQEEVETLKNHFKATSERIQAKLKGPFTLEKGQSDVKEEAEILVADFKTTLNRNAGRVKSLLSDASAKVEKQVEEVKEEVKKATKKAKATA